MEIAEEDLKEVGVVGVVGLVEERKIVPGWAS